MTTTHPVSHVSGIHLNSLLGADRVVLEATDRPDTWTILDLTVSKTLGTVTHPADSVAQLELFVGKGGFMAMLSAPGGARYFALPGAKISLLGTTLTLIGASIEGNTHKPVCKPQAVTPQQHTLQATILGAGLATRFERVSGDSTQYSKPAVPLVGKKTVIECIADNLARHGYPHLIVNTFFKPESIKAGLATSEAKKVDYIDESEPSGTAGGLRKMLTMPQYQPMLDLNTPLLVVQGDSVTDADFSALMEAHIAHGALVTLGCQTVPEKDVDKFGIIVTDASGSDGQSGRISAFQEKPSLAEAKSRLGNTGFYIFSPKAFPLVRDIYEGLLADAQAAAKANHEPIPSEIALDFANDLFPAILARSQAEPKLGAFWAERVEGYWSDIGNPVQYLETLHDVYAGKVNIPLPQDIERYYENGVIYWEGGKEAALAENAQLEGNVIVAMPFGTV